MNDKFKSQLLASYPESLIEHIKSGEEVNGFWTTDKSVFELESSTGFVYFKDTVRHIRRLYVPSRQQQKELLLMAHDVQTHHGIDRTLDKLDQFYWKGMAKSVRDYVLYCPECLRNKTHRHKQYGLLKPVQTPDLPFKTVTLDFITNLPKCASILAPGDVFDKLLTVTDKFSKAVILIPGKSTWGAEEWAIAYHRDVYKRWGWPLAFISDRDPIFMASLWTALFRLVRAKALATSAYHAPADGQSERTNQAVVIALRYFVDAVQDGWVDALPEIERSINDSKNSTTGHSPNQLIYGLELRSSIYAIRPLPNDTQLAKLVDLRRCYREDARDSIQLMTKLMENNANRLRKPLKLEVGDDVYLSLRTGYTLPSVKKAKLGPQRCGPFKVLEVLGHGNAAKLKFPPNYRIHNVISVVHLEKAPPGQEPFDRQPPEETKEHILVEDDGGEQWTIEQILDHRQRRIGRSRMLHDEYLIRWKGWDAAYDQWVRKEDIHPKEVEDFEQRRRTK